MTSRNLDVLRTIVQLHDSTGYMPTVRELGETLGMASPSTVHKHLDRLEALGLIERHHQRRRVTDLGRSVLDVTAVAA